MHLKILICTVQGATKLLMKAFFLFGEGLWFEKNSSDDGSASNCLEGRILVISSPLTEEGTLGCVPPDYKKKGCVPSYYVLLVTFKTGLGSTSSVHIRATAVSKEKSPLNDILVY